MIPSLPAVRERGKNIDRCRVSIDQAELHEGETRETCSKIVHIYCEIVIVYVYN